MQPKAMMKPRMTGMGLARLRPPMCQGRREVPADGGSSCEHLRRTGHFLSREQRNWCAFFHQMSAGVGRRSKKSGPVTDPLKALACQEETSMNDLLPNRSPVVSAKGALGERQSSIAP